jgi:predicted anti-sigma-YlaC factor YlaD
VIHEDFLLRATLNLEQALDASAQAELASHLESCAECREEWQRMRVAHGALAAWGAQPVPATSVPGAAVPATPIAAVRASRPTGRGVPWTWLAAASLAGIVLGAGGGFAVGTARSAPSPEPIVAARPVYALLLEEPATAWPPTDGGMRPGYVAWRDSLDAAAVFAGGDRFVSDAGWYVSRDGIALPADGVAEEIRRAPNYSGYFLVYAANDEEAIAIARSSPHLAFGGILLRRSATR